MPHPYVTNNKQGQTELLSVGNMFMLCSYILNTALFYDGNETSETQHHCIALYQALPCLQRKACLGKLSSDLFRAYTASLATTQDTKTLRNHI